MDDDTVVVAFEGSQTIEKAEAVKESLLTAIQSKKINILLDISKIEKIDSSFLQLIYSASLEADKKNKKISLSGKISESVKEIIKLSGFDINIDNNPLALME